MNRNIIFRILDLSLEIYILERISLGLNIIYTNCYLILLRVGDTHVKSEHIAEKHIVLNDLCLILRKSDPYIESLLKDIPPLAQQCSLKDIVPQNSVSDLFFSSGVKYYIFSCV